MTIDEMIARKRELGYTNERIAELSGVPLGTVQKIFAKSTKAPRRSTVEALEALLRKTKPYGMETPGIQMLRDSGMAYAAGNVGPYTIKDYYALPEDQRAELIDGYLYDMAAPDYVHQRIVLKLWSILDQCISANSCQCMAFAAPADVQLDQNDKTMLQPDVMILCHRENLRKNRYIGAPDYIAEVLSDSTRQKDMFIKLNKYRFAGVREYWIIDPKHQVVQVYDLVHDMPVEKYLFTDRIPVLISEGRCVVEFEVINREIAPLVELE